MALRRAGLGIAICVLLLFSAGAAGAAGQWLVSGSLDHVDEERKVIEVNGHELIVSVRSEIRRGDSLPGNWDDVVARDGDHVSVLVERGYRGVEAVTIVLDDAVED